MLNIGRMAPGSHDYYLAVVAAGVEDYYLAHGEAPGRWLGRGAELLGLEGPVEAHPLRHVLAGTDPHTGARLAAHPARKVPGFDLTFRAPKSVSLLWALADGAVATEVREAHDAAVNAAISFLEREAARTRRGAGGSERVEVDGLIAAAFRHRTSRAGDPLLHTHVLVANLARTADDGVWRTLESRRLFLYAKTAGYLYQAHLRHELTRRLGVAWQPVRNGYADLSGVPRWLVDAFSRRRQAILQRLDERGETSAKAAQVATLETRAAKEGQASEAELRRAWVKRAELMGFDPARLDRLLHRDEVAAPDVDALATDLIHREALTEHSATFALRDLLQAVSERLPNGAPVEALEELADELLQRGRESLVVLGPRRGRLASVNAIRRNDGRIVVGDDSEPRLTTRGLLLAEHQAISSAVARRDTAVAVVPERIVDTVVVSRPTLASEQVDMVRRRTLEGDGVAVVLGRAGTGKTFALDAAREVWQRADIAVHGVALAARAARELQDSTGIASTTIHQLLTSIEDPARGSPLRPGSVLVVDEAGMVGTRMLAELLAHAERQRVKVVLVGDPRQLPEIEAGGLFALLAQRLDAVELNTNRRQRHAWEVAALDELRHGDPTTALDAYRTHGRIITGESAEAVREELVADWWQALDRAGATSAVMVALRQCDVADLNARARQHLDASGRLTDPPLEVDGIDFRAGDRILCLRNDRRLGVVNGTFATIEDLDVEARSLTVRTDDGAHVTLQRAYLDAGNVTHGYAITGHKVQGLTVDQAFVLGSAELYREWGYVALSRGRDSNRLYVHPASIDPDGVMHGYQRGSEPLQHVIAALHRSRAETAAAVHGLDLEELGARWRALRTRLETANGGHRAELSQQRDALGRDAQHLDRIIARLEEQRDATARGLGRATRRAALARLEVDLEQRRRARERLADQIHNMDQQLASLPSPEQLRPLLRDYHAASADLAHVAKIRTMRSEQHPPGYLLLTLGRCPDDPFERQRWRTAVQAIEHYRLRWSLTDPRLPLGSEPSNAAMRADREEAMRTMLGQSVLPEREHRTLGRGLGR